MATQPKEDIASHQISGLTEALTPSSSGKDAREGAPETTEVTSPAPQQESGGGGVTGYLKSWIGGGGSQEATPHPDQKTTHSQDLKDGSTAAVHTAPGSTAVPDSLKEGPQTVGAAKTEIQAPVSEYASALEGIAGEPVAPDPTAKYGPALGPITGDAPAQGTGTGVVGAVTAAAGSVVQTVKHVVGYEGDPADGETGATPAGGGERPEQSTQGTGPSTHSEGSSGGVLTPADLPKSGVVSTDGTGSVDIEAKQQPGYLSSAAGAVSGAASGLKNTVTGLVGGGTTASTATAGGRSTAQPGYEGESSSSRKPQVLYEDEDVKAKGPGANPNPAGTDRSSETISTATPAATNAPTGGATAAPVTSSETSSATTAPSKGTAAPSAISAAGSAASTEAAKAGPSDAKKPVAEETSTKADPHESSSVSAPKSHPPVSAFAAESQSSPGAKRGEIVEDAGSKKVSQGAASTAGPAAGSKAAQGAEQAKTAPEKPAAKQEEKEKSKCCGCVIQ